ncbi:abc transporter [Pyrrhoderma noxium]|uniref:Abc transporter n=1 Tax=Pyrrhoderma noxium TaxID=2282107 RepID=A0A286U9A7_9AGAM|nr:abc transporter [Pyrrhoderma noxium]
MSPRAGRLAAYGLLLSLCVSPALSTNIVDSRNSTSWSRADQSYRLSALASTPLLVDDRPKDCPPCFNCMLPAFTCGQYGKCDSYDGQCHCPAGWGGIDCLTPQCDSLADEHRRMWNGEKECSCKDGWGGINCNVCETDDACANFPLPGGDSSIPGGSDTTNMTCYKGGDAVFNNHQMCDVTNPGIIALLPDRPPQVTFSCNKIDGTCLFQFWVNRVESFYCGLESCKSKVVQEPGSNKTVYECEDIQCSCIPGRFICGENGSVDITEFLDTEIKGPAKFSCKTGSECKFEEPGMNDLIDTIFGDNYITLKCNSGECLHYSQVPGYVSIPVPDNTRWVALSAAGAILIVLSSFILLWYAGRDRKHSGEIRLPETEAFKLMNEHVPAALHFSDISYSLGSRTILSEISGCVKPGQVMAIMGASGAGKSTFLDILARRRKRGQVGGKILVNGREVTDSEFKRFVGFVDQEDTLMSTLTVYETVLYSALLRLPREMSIEAKKYRTLETMNELGILGIRDMRIGDAGHRSISGGEKRRVSIACELVTSPSILFLDEPTSGLDAYNAFNVVDSLVSLARNYNRTVVFTIHQPRSNIVSLFDHLLLLAQGRMVYSGEVSKCHEFLADVGRSCPPGFNLTDYLIDLTTEAELDARPQDGNSLDTDLLSRDDASNLADEERGFSGNTQSSHISTNGNSSSSTHIDETELQSRRGSIASDSSHFVKRKTSQLIDVIRGNQHKGNRPLSPQLASLVDGYAASDIAAGIRSEIASLSNRNPEEELPDVAEENRLLRGRRGASWLMQFRILSGRAFKNLYRDPALLMAHYLSSIILALICGYFFRSVKNDIGGFQNRLGIFFFSLALFGFSCLTVIGLFANERLLYMRERANGYYSSFTYFASKVLFDILPLRVVPPLVFGAIVYRLVGLVPEVTTFWKFLLVLVLFNLATASAVLLISVAFASSSVASLVGTLIMLFNLLFAGLLVNRESLGKASWLSTISFFHAAFEALAVNELRYLQLREVKYGVEIDVPAATILNIFGLRAQSFWWPNVSLLGIFFGVFTVATWVLLHYHVREQR